MSTRTAAFKPGTGQAADLVGRARDSERGRAGCRGEVPKSFGRSVRPPGNGFCLVLLGDCDDEGVDGEAGRVLGGQRHGHESDYRVLFSVFCAPVRWGTVIVPLALLVVALCVALAGPGHCGSPSRTAP